MNKIMKNQETIVAKKEVVKMNINAENETVNNVKKEETNMNTTAKIETVNSAKKEETNMNTTAKNETVNKANEEARRIIMIEECKDEPGTYACHVINTLGLSVSRTLRIPEDSLAVLPLVFSTDICNFRLVDGKVVKGWTENAMDALEEFVKNVHESCMKADEEPDNGWDNYDVAEDDDDETCWDADIPESERVTNPSSSEIFARLEEMARQNKAGKAE